MKALQKQPHASSPRRTPEQFEQWLARTLQIYQKIVDQGLPWPMRATRFEYWYSEVVSPAWENVDPAAYRRIRALEDPRHSAMRVAVADLDNHKHVSPPSWQEQFEENYRVAHKKGDVEAIFEFAREDREALQAPWVVDQLIAWRLEDTLIAKRKFGRFMRAYWSMRGTRKGVTNLEIIKRDQAIYSSFLHRNHAVSREIAIGDIADQHDFSADSVKDVLKKYKKFYREWSESSLFPRLSIPPCR